MAAEHSKLLPVGDEWFYEPGFAGDRVLAVKEDAGVRLHTIPHGRDVTNRFPVLAALVARLRANLIVLDATLCGIETWQQDAFAASSSGSAPPFGSTAIRLIATDLLWLDAIDVRQSPLIDRKLRLRELIAGTAALEPLALSAPPAELLLLARRYGAEAVIAKRRNSRYRPFARSGDWVRVPVDAGAVRDGDSSGAAELQLAT